MKDPRTGDSRGGAAAAGAPPVNVPLEEVRFLLWDIDGTLMSSVKDGSYRSYFGAVLQQVFGSAGRLDEVQSSGMTDFQIFYESLREEGFGVEEIRAKLPDVLRIFPVEMRRAVEAAESHRLLGGVAEILRATDEHPRYVNALLTGNFEPAARIKTGIFGIDKYFDFSLSAFGESSHDRNDLGFAALERARRKFDYDFEPSQFIVIGDTPKDVACARAFGAKMLAVGTGKSHPGKTLLECEPDALLENLENTAEVMRTLEELS